MTSVEKFTGASVESVVVVASVVDWDVADVDPDIGPDVDVGSNLDVPVESGETHTKKYLKITGQLNNAMSPLSKENAHAYLCNLRNYKFLSKILESDSLGIRSKNLYHEIQNFSLN